MQYLCATTTRLCFVNACLKINPITRVLGHLKTRVWKRRVTRVPESANPTSVWLGLNCCNMSWISENHTFKHVNTKLNSNANVGYCQTDYVPPLNSCTTLTLFFSWLVGVIPHTAGLCNIIPFGNSTMIRFWKKGWPCMPPYSSIERLFFTLLITIIKDIQILLFH